ncbi:MAG: amidase [Chloroflexi bacterium]|nr:amidase [Chloroflexota bacterium]
MASEDEELDIRRQQIRAAIQRLWETDAAERQPTGGFRVAGPASEAGEGRKEPARRPGAPATSTYRTPNGQAFTAAELGRRYRARELSPIEVTKDALGRAEAEQGRLNAFITVTPELALEAARAAEARFARGEALGPLDGVPVGVKDIIAVAGVRNTAASRILSGNVPSTSAPVVERLLAGGAVIIGKTNLHEFAYGGTGDRGCFGPARNPWNAEHMTGGSSSGSAAAVAAGICPIALGTDTAGSVRIPAALCGIVGLKPTYGRVPTQQVVPLSWNMDHVGPMTGTVEDAALALSAMCDFEPAPFVQPVGPRKVGVCRTHFWEHLDGEVRRLAEAAIRDLGEIEEIDLPSIGIGAAAQAVITAAEAGAYHRRWLDSRPLDYDPAVRARLEATREVTGHDYVQALRVRALLGEEMAAALRHVDVLASPTEPVAAPRFGETEVMVEDGPLNAIGALIRNTAPANTTGFPAISVPCGFTSGGLPVGLQLIGAPWQEARLLQIAYHACQL